MVVVVLVVVEVELEPGRRWQATTMDEDVEDDSIGN